MLPSIRLLHHIIFIMSFVTRQIVTLLYIYLASFHNNSYLLYFSIEIIQIFYRKQVLF